MSNVFCFWFCLISLIKINQWLYFVYFILLYFQYEINSSDLEYYKKFIMDFVYSYNILFAYRYYKNLMIWKLFLLSKF